MAKRGRRSRAKALEFAPATLGHLREIELWLQADFEAAGREGFWHNWNVILGTFADNRVLCAVENEAVVGFAVWSESSGADAGVVRARVFEIEIVVVKSDRRGRGVGQAIVTALLESFRRLGGIAVRGHCSPKSSITFWRDVIGMRAYPPESGQTDPDRLFMFLPPETSLVSLAGAGTFDVRADFRDNREKRQDFASHSSPATLYSAGFQGEDKTLALALPVLHAVRGDTVLRLSVGGTVLFDDKVYKLSFRGCDYTPPFLRIFAIHADQYARDLRDLLGSLND